eukprot:UN22565
MVVEYHYDRQSTGDQQYGRAYVEVSPDQNFGYNSTKYTNYDDNLHTTYEIVFDLNSKLFPVDQFKHTNVWIRVDSEQATNGAFSLDLRASEKDITPNKNKQSYPYPKLQKTEDLLPYITTVSLDYTVSYQEYQYYTAGFCGKAVQYYEFSVVGLPINEENKAAFQMSICNGNSDPQECVADNPRVAVGSCPDDSNICTVTLTPSVTGYNAENVLISVLGSAGTCVPNDTCDCKDVRSPICEYAYENAFYLTMRGVYALS